MPHKVHTTTPAASAGHNSIDKSKLKELVSRIEDAENEKLAIAADLRGLYQEARSSGFDVTALRAVIRMRRQDKNERDALQATIDEYMHSLGMLADLPLGKAASERAGLAPPV